MKHGYTPFLCEQDIGTWTFGTLERGKPASLKLPPEHGGDGGQHLDWAVVLFGAPAIVSCGGTITCPEILLGIAGDGER